MENKQTTFFVTDLGNDHKLYVDKFQYILKKDGVKENIGYFSSLTQLIYFLFSNKIKMSLKEKTTLEEISKAVKESEKNILALAKKLEIAVEKKLSINEQE